MLKIVEFILKIQALINVGTIYTPPINTFDKIMNFITYTFSSLYIFIGFNNLLKLNESYIVKLLFIENFDYLLLKILVTNVSNFMELYKGNIVRVLINAAMYNFYNNKNTFFNLMFSGILFREIVIPSIIITYNNIFLGKDIYLVESEKNKLINCLYYLSAIYFLVIVITQKYIVV